MNKSARLFKLSDLKIILFLVFALYAIKMAVDLRDAQWRRAALPLTINGGPEMKRPADLEEFLAELTYERAADGYVYKYQTNIK